MNTYNPKKSSWKCLILNKWKWVLLLITIAAAARFSIVGQLIDDLTITFLFGWTKLIIYPFLVFLIINSIFGFYKLKFNWQIFTKSLWFSFNFLWTLGLIGIVILILQNNLSLISHNSYTLHSNFSIYIDAWNKASFLSEPVFFWFASGHTYLSPVAAGGVLGMMIAGGFNYFYVVIAILLLIISWCLWSAYFWYNNPLFVFLSKEEKIKFYWERIKSIRDPVQVMNRIQDQDVTMELPTSQQIVFLEERAGASETSIEDQIKQPKVSDNDYNKIQTVSWDINKTPSKPIDARPEVRKTTPLPAVEKSIVNNSVQSNSKNSLPNRTIFLNLKNNDSEIEKKARNYEIAERKKIIMEKVFDDSRVGAEIKNIIVGPNVTKYEIRLNEGANVKQILELKSQLQFRLGEIHMRMEAPIQGKDAVGIELNNKYPTTVVWKDVLSKLLPEPGSLKLAIGKKVTNDIAIMRLEKLPHLLIAGSTGGGKSVCLSAIIASMIYQMGPDNLKLLLIDPKRVELASFHRLPHLVGPVITEMNEVPIALILVIKEIDLRFKKLNEAGVRNITEYNKKVDAAQQMSYFVIVVDEFADLILDNKKKIEPKIVKISQIGRAAGVFLILATQRPSAEVITGLIKNNIPGRIAFRVTSAIDSRTILGVGGAELLAGKGDLLYKNPEAKNLERSQGVWISEDELFDLTNFWVQKHGLSYWADFANIKEVMRKQAALAANGFNSSDADAIASDEDNQLYESIYTWARVQNYVSVSKVQRQFGIGYNRAAKICEKMEFEGVLEAAEGTRPRKVIK